LLLSSFAPQAGHSSGIQSLDCLISLATPTCTTYKKKAGIIKISFFEICAITKNDISQSEIKN